MFVDYEESHQQLRNFCREVCAVDIGEDSSTEGYLRFYVGRSKRSRNKTDDEIRFVVGESDDNLRRAITKIIRTTEFNKHDSIWIEALRKGDTAAFARFNAKVETEPEAVFNTDSPAQPKESNRYDVDMRLVDAVGNTNLMLRGLVDDMAGRLLQTVADTKDMAFHLGQFNRETELMEAFQKERLIANAIETVGPKAVEVFGSIVAANMQKKDAPPPPPKKEGEPEPEGPPSGGKELQLWYLNAAKLHCVEFAKGFFADPSTVDAEVMREVENLNKELTEAVEAMKNHKRSAND